MTIPCRITRQLFTLRLQEIQRSERAARTEPEAEYSPRAQEAFKPDRASFAGRLGPAVGTTNACLLPAFRVSVSRRSSLLFSSKIRIGTEDVEYDPGFRIATPVT